MTALSRFYPHRISQPGPFCISTGDWRVVADACACWVACGGVQRALDMNTGDARERAAAMEAAPEVIGDGGASPGGL